jgi:hypothetical protein
LTIAPLQLADLKLGRRKGAGDILSFNKLNIPGEIPERQGGGTEAVGVSANLAKEAGLLLGRPILDTLPGGVGGKGKQLFGGVKITIP